MAKDIVFMVSPQIASQYDSEVQGPQAPVWAELMLTRCRLRRSLDGCGSCLWTTQCRGALSQAARHLKAPARQTTGMCFVFWPELLVCGQIHALPLTTHQDKAGLRPSAFFAS